jgi:SpoVK/Ycf46/Vps4 family AAA+-type ATPase
MIKKGGVVFIGEHPHILIKCLAQFRSIEPERPVVVILEDIDTIISMYGESAVLSVLDGEAQVSNIVFLATSNYPEKLDGRVINRPSRFDKIVKIDLPNAEARKMFLESKISELIVDGVDLVKETDGLSIAHLKELIISVYCQENPVKEVVARLSRMKYRVKSDPETGGGPIGIGR